MKIKLDFVTNSSSTCYLISSPKRITKVLLGEYGMRLSRIDYLHIITNREALIKQASGRDECDWISKATGPDRFWGMSEEWYKKGLSALEDAEYICLIDIDRNYFEDIQKFERIIEDDINGSILGVTSD